MYCIILWFYVTYIINIVNVLFPIVFILFSLPFLYELYFIVSPLIALRAASKSAWPISLITISLLLLLFIPPSVLLGVGMHVIVLFVCVIERGQSLYAQLLVIKINCPMSTQNNEKVLK